ncbi:MAG: hypothetical protein C0599_05775 [Salinivirgaceae bacterium]|nr:MAG: hypothetical protein C0599_05775 [Salinivirgaceae bacterium]
MRKTSIRIAFRLLIIILLGSISSKDLLAQDITLDPPVIDSISVDILPNGQYRCILGWEPYDWTGYNTDSSGFIVRDVYPLGGFSNPDTIYDAFATFYFDSTSNPIEDIQGFGLDAFTYVNGQFINGVIANQHSQNIQVEVANYNSCQTAVYLSWNTYYDDEATSGTIEPPYDVFAVSANDYRKASASSNSFVFSGLNQNEEYTFRVRAIAEDFTSTSTPTSYLVSKPGMPSPAEFTTLSTNSNFDNSIFINADENLTGHLVVFKSSEVDFGFDTLEEYAAIPASLELTDFVGTGDVRYYYIETQDLCLETKLYSDTINSLILSAANRYSYIELTSNDYQFGDAEYFLHRIADGQESVFDVNAPIQYNDFDILAQSLSNPNVDYRLESFTEDSVQLISNPVRVIIKDELKWPNAIIAGDYSVDGIFRPFIRRSIPEYYNLKIFNKWGQLLFESNNIENGWDGTYKGNYVLPGGYLYVATFKFEGSKEKVKRGTVTVIH